MTIPLPLGCICHCGWIGTARSRVEELVQIISMNGEMTYQVKPVYMHYL